MSERLHSNSFSECLNTEFHVMDNGAAILSLKLINVIEGLKTPRQESFSVVFRGPTNKLMQQGIYKLQNHKLGERDLFLVPVAKDEDGYQYEAVFNYLLSK